MLKERLVFLVSIAGPQLACFIHQRFDRRCFCAVFKFQTVLESAYGRRYHGLKRRISPYTHFGFKTVDASFRVFEGIPINSLKAQNEGVVHFVFMDAGCHLLQFPPFVSVRVKQFRQLDTRVIDLVF